MHNLPAFIDELYFLFGVTALEKSIYLGQYIKRDGVGKNLRNCGFARKKQFGLIQELLDRLGAGPGGRARQDAIRARPEYRSRSAEPE